MKVFDDPDLLNKKITIESMDHLRSLFNQGYEISNIQMEWNFKGGRNTVFTVLLRRGNDRLLADAGEVADYVIQLKSLPNFEKKKNSFIPVSDSRLYFFMELKFIDIALGDHSSPISVKKVDLKNPQVVYQLLFDCIQENVKLKHKNADLPQLFFSVFTIKIQGDDVDLECHSKDSLNIITIQRFIQESQKYDRSLAVSFILLAEKNPDPSEMLIGIIVYDLQARNTICFNIQSVAAFRNENSSENERLETLLDRVAISLFNRSVNEKMECKSYLPLPIHTKWYAPLPWITYLALQPTTMKYTIIAPGRRNITIPEFLTFGYAEDYHTKNSFQLQAFSKETSGHATVILNFNDENKSLRYVLRLDQWSGDTLLHIDYSVYDPREQKFIEHYPLDLEMIYQFSSDLFVAILAAAMFDANFSTIVEKGLKGVAQLQAKNPAYLYAFSHIFTLEKALEWFDEKPDRYEILRKVSSGDQLSDQEKDEIDYMHKNFLGIIAADRGRQGIGLMGDAILLRHDRNQINVRVSK